MNLRVALIGAALLGAAAATPAPAPAAEALKPARQRFENDEAREVPDFQRHILPLMGRLGCNTRSCHGSFQGRGDFRLSLFGYDFKMDHDALMKPGSKRIDTELAEASKIIQKPTLAIPHKGGKRLEEDTWQYRMLMNWIEAGARGVEDPAHFERLEVTPTELVFKQAGEKVALRVVAHWSDGVAEDVTCIARFRTNDESIAEIDEDGVVTSKGPGDTHVVAFYDNGIAVTQVLQPVTDKVGPKYPDVPTPTKIDALVVAKLRKLGLVPSALCTDAEFLRRVSLDMTGTLPAPEEIEAFVADSTPGKRAAKIDELLARPTYAAWWANRLCDVTEDNARALNQGNQSVAPQMARHWYEWIYKRVSDNMPYDRLIAGIVLATSRKPGQSYDDYVKEQGSYYRGDNPADFAQRDTMPYFWARGTVRKPEEKALSFSYAFLGVRLECAQCHKHPFDQWTQDDFNRFTAFFNSVGYGTAPDARQRLVALNEELGLNNKKATGANKQKIAAEAIKAGKDYPWTEVFVARNGAMAKSRGKNAKSAVNSKVTPRVLGGDEVSLDGTTDPRAPLMEWMRQKDNPYFARAFINRVWASYFGSGIINPPDDMNLANPPSNAALLDYLTDGFIAHNYDMKWLHREITASDTYQRSWRPNDTNRLDERNFSRAVVRRLPAEVITDAIAQATATAATLARAATDVEDRSFGAKGNGGNYRKKGNADFAAKVFGRSTRETNCDCNRSDEPNLLQSIYLQNDQDVIVSIENNGWLAEATGAAAKARKGGKTAPAPAFDADATTRAAFLRTLSRRPTDHEAELARAHFTQAGDEAKGLRDLLWSLLNTKEFITNH